MIETEHVSVARAAELLGTDTDTLLIAAVEGRIRLWALVNAMRSVEYSRYEGEGEDCFLVTVGHKPFEHVVFWPVSSLMAGNLLRDGTGDFAGTFLDDKEDGVYCRDDCDTYGERDPVIVSRANLFMKRADVESMLKVNKFPEAGTIRESHLAPRRSLRAETTYQNIIGGLLGLMLGKTPAGKAQSVFESQSAIISALLAHHDGKPGISSRTLEEKFAEAKRSLNGS